MYLLGKWVCNDYNFKPCNISDDHLSDFHMKSTFLSVWSTEFLLPAKIVTPEELNVFLLLLSLVTRGYVSKPKGHAIKQKSKW